MPRRNGPGGGSGAAPTSDDLGDHRQSSTGAGHRLTIPELPEDCDPLTAALEYAKCCWYVLPVRRGSKNPGSIVGERWQDKSSRDPQQLVAWFAGTNYGIALHTGRSGAVVLDVDNPAELPDYLRKAIDQCNPPCQATRADLSRLHYVFVAAPGRRFTNSKHPWGELKAGNGIIVVEPSKHEKASECGEYRWL